MSVGLSPLAGAGWQFFDDNGVILTGGKIYTYLAGTTTPEATYTDSSGNTSHSNPIILDAAGKIPGGEVWLDQQYVYKFVIKTSDDVLLDTYDNISSISFGFTRQDATGDGSTTSYALTVIPASINNTQIYINGVYQNKATYTLVGSLLNFSEAPPYNSAIEIMSS